MFKYFSEYIFITLRMSSLIWFDVETFSRDNRRLYKKHPQKKTAQKPTSERANEPKKQLDHWILFGGA